MITRFKKKTYSNDFVPLFLDKIILNKGLFKISYGEDREFKNYQSIINKFDEILCSNYTNKISYYNYNNDISYLIYKGMLIRCCPNNEFTVILAFLVKRIYLDTFKSLYIYTNIVNPNYCKLYYSPCYIEPDLDKYVKKYVDKYPTNIVEKVSSMSFLFESLDIKDDDGSEEWSKKMNKIGLNYLKTSVEFEKNYYY